MAKVNLTTENAIVNAVGKMAFTGNVIPESWYKTVVSSNGRVNLLAVNLLGETVYWYRPMEIRDEKSGDVTWEKKFADDDFLQRSYSKIYSTYYVGVYVLAMTGTNIFTVRSVRQDLQRKRNRSN